MKQEQNNIKVGRTNIWDKRRTGSHSKRSEKGDLDIILRKCQNCGHHKSFNGNISGLNIKKCCKCKHYVKEDFKL